MSKDRKTGPGSKQKRAGELLDELDSVKSLLGDAADDVPPSAISDEDDVPLLGADEDPEEAQIPLLGQDPATPPAASASSKDVSDAVRRALAERNNPFLSAAAKASAAQPAASKAPPPAPTGAAASPAPATQPDVEAIVEEVLDEWMPKIEQAVRQRLLAALKRR